MVGVEDRSLGQRGLFLSVMPPTPRDSRVALALIVLSVAVFAALVPFATTPLAPLPAFIPAYQAALMFSDLATAVVIYGQYSILRSRSLLILGTGYLFTALAVVPHTLSFPNALRAALREDPDYILVGEMRDLETIRLAMTAAETGHLVFATLHTSSAAKTVDRIIDVFPAAEKDMVRAMLSESLVAVISQTLLKTKDGQGRVAAHEIMIGTPAIRNLIRENKVAQMYSSIQTGQSIGMQTLDQCLIDLVRRNVIAASEARMRAVNKETFGAA